MSCPRKRASSKLKPGMMARAAGYWIARSSRAMTSLEGRKDRPRRFLDLPGTRSLDPVRSRSYFRRGSGHRGFDGRESERAVSSAGRALCSHRRGHWFEIQYRPPLQPLALIQLFARGKLLTEQVEISAVTAQSQQEVSLWLQSASEELSGRSKSEGSVSDQFRVRSTCARTPRFGLGKWKFKLTGVTCLATPRHFNG